MIGVYDYTVILTYLSALSGVVGIILTMTGMGHPYCGALLLMVCGLLDGFDGKVARTKKNRSEYEKKFGVQIDSLTDLICFGVLPAAIGLGQLRAGRGIFTEVGRGADRPEHFGLILILVSIAGFYVLAALVRLAYFNATEEERAEEAKIMGREFFTGIPVTTAALAFPLTLIIHWFTSVDMTTFYFWMLFIMGLLFVSNFKIPKPNKKEFAVIIFIGLVEFVSVFVILFF